MWPVGRGAPGCKTGVEIPTKRRPQNSLKVAQLIVSSEFTVIWPGRLSQHLLSFCKYFTLASDKSVSCRYQISIY